MSLPTHLEIINAMEEYVLDKKKPMSSRGCVFNWMSEYSQENHIRMVVIVNKLLKINPDYYDEDFDIPKEDIKEIFKLGCDIHNSGGFTAQQACYYIAVNFISKHNNVKAIEYCWNNAGDWKN